jgi:hypothetical protein
MAVLRPGGGLLAVVVASFLAMPQAQAPASATFGWGDDYELPAGAVVPKDLYVVANEATIDGTVEGDVAVVARRVHLGGTVKGNTNIVAARIDITGRPLGIVRTVGAAQIIPPSPLPGQVLPTPGAPLPAPTATPASTAARFTTLSLEAAPAQAPAQVEAQVQAQPQAQPRPVVSWWQTTGQLLLGFAVVGGLLLWRAPGALLRPAGVLAAHPWRSLLIGLLAAQFSLLLPLATGALVLLMGVFWGWFPAVLLAVALAAGFGLLWYLSPLVTGVWLGRRLGPLLGRGPDSLPVLVGGVLLLVLLGQLPRFGWLVYLASFLLALGGLLSLAATARPGLARAPALPSAPVPEPLLPEPLPAAPTGPLPAAPVPVPEPFPAVGAADAAPAAPPPAAAPPPVAAPPPATD